MHQENQPLIQQIITNKVVVNRKGGRVRQTTYFLPCYLQFQVKQIDLVDKQHMQARLRGMLRFSFYYGGVPVEKIQKFIGYDHQQAITLLFNQQDPITLRQSKQGITMKHQKQESMIYYSIISSFRVDLKGKMFLAPFIIINFYLMVTPLAVSIQNQNYKFNFMESKKVAVIIHGPNLTFSHLIMAPYYFETKYSNQKTFPFQDDGKVDSLLLKTDGDSSIMPFKYAHFKVSIFQDSLNSLLMVFIPLWLLGIIGLFIYFQKQSFGARLATISVLALSEVFSLVSTIKQSIPPSPKLKITQILILLLLLATFLLLLQSYKIKDQPNYKFIWHDNTFFLASAFINILTFTILFAFYILHRLKWAPMYVKLNERDRNKVKEKKINREKWENQDCDKYFKRLKMDEHSIQNLNAQRSQFFIKS